MLIISLRHLAW